VQARHFGPQLSPEPSTQIVKTKKRIVEALDAEKLAIYNIMQETVAALVLEDL